MKSWTDGREGSSISRGGGEGVAELHEAPGDDEGDESQAMTL